MVIRLISGKLASDCYYEDIQLADFSEELKKEIQQKVSDGVFQIQDLEQDVSFQKSKHDYSEDELLDVGDIDFHINELACSQRVLAPDGFIYYCPGFVELKEPICHIRDYEEKSFNEHLEDMYFKKLFMCTGDSTNDLRRFCPVKKACDKKMCYYLNKKITGETRFPFSRFCAIKELKYKIKMSEKNLDVLMLLLNSIAKLNEAILSFGTASPDFNLRNRANQIVKDVSANIESILSQMEGKNDSTQSGG